MVNKDSILNDIKKEWIGNYLKSNLKNKITISNSLDISIINSDAVVIITEWEEFKNIEKKHNKIFDGRNILKNSFYSIGI